MAVALIVLPVLAALSYVISFGVDVPYWDEWDYVGRGFDWRGLFAQHNEHRIPVTRALLLLFERLGGGDSRLPMFANLAALAGVLVLLVRDHREARAPLAFFVPVSWLLFTFRQDENFLWGAQLTVALCALSAVASFTLLQSCESSVPRFVGAVACALGASLTFSSGLLTWPTGLLQLLVQRKRGRLWAAVAWCLAAAITTILYLKGYRKPAQHPSTLAFVSNPAIGLEYFFASLGSTFTTDLWQGIAEGAVLFVISGALLWSHFRGPPAERPPSIGPSLVIFAFGTSAMLTVGRSGFGAEQALSSRYVTLTVLGPVGAWLLATRLRDSRRGAALCAGLLTLGCIGAVVTTREALRNGPVVRDARQELQYLLLTYEDQPDDALRRLSPSPEVRRIARVLQGRRQSVFGHAPREPEERLEGPTAFALDTINHQSVPSGKVVRVDSKDGFIVGGWAVDSRAQGASRGVWLSFDGRHDVPTRYGFARPDVAKSLHARSYESSGFAATMALTSIGTGRHLLTLKIATADGRAYYESAPPITLEVR